MTEPKSPLSLQDIQRAVDAWISQWEEGYFSPLSNLARLTEEVGELAREINASHGEKPKKPGTAPSSAGAEMADILFVLVCLANSMDVDLSEEFAAVMHKYNIRDAERWTPKS